MSVSVRVKLYYPAKCTSSTGKITTLIESFREKNGQTKTKAKKTAKPGPVCETMPTVGIIWGIYYRPRPVDRQR